MSETNDIEATADVGEAFLEHYGVKGMKWGVRRDRPSNVDIKAARAVRKAGRQDVKAAKNSVKIAKQNLKSAKENYNTMPEKQIARYMTTGEQRAVKIVAGAAVVTTSAIALKSSLPAATNVASKAVVSGPGPSAGMMPAHYANVGETVSVWWR